MKKMTLVIFNALKELDRMLFALMNGALFFAGFTQGLEAKIEAFKFVSEPAYCLVKKRFDQSLPSSLLQSSRLNFLKQISAFPLTSHAFYLGGGFSKNFGSLFKNIQLDFGFIVDHARRQMLRQWLQIKISFSENCPARTSYPHATQTSFFDPELERAFAFQDRRLLCGQLIDFFQSLPPGMLIDIRQIVTTEELNAAQRPCRQTLEQHYTVYAASAPECGYSHLNLGQTSLITSESVPINWKKIIIGSLIALTVITVVVWGLTPEECPHEEEEKKLRMFAGNKESEAPWVENSLELIAEPSKEHLN